MRMSKIAPTFERKSKSSFGLKQMEDEETPMSTKKAVQMQTEAVPALANISPMEKAHCKAQAWKPKGRK